METEQANDKDEQVGPHKSCFPLWVFHSSCYIAVTPALLLCLWSDVFAHQNKMQTDQDEQQNQGDSPKEPEEKTPENEEMEVRSFCCIFRITNGDKAMCDLLTDYNEVRCRLPESIKTNPSPWIWYWTNHHIFLSRVVSVLCVLCDFYIESWIFFRPPQRRLKVRKNLTSRLKPKSLKLKQKCWSYPLKTVRSGSWPSTCSIYLWRTR